MVLYLPSDIGRGLLRECIMVDYKHVQGRECGVCKGGFFKGDYFAYTEGVLGPGEHWMVHVQCLTTLKHRKDALSKVLEKNGEEITEELKIPEDLDLCLT